MVEASFVPAVMAMAKGDVTELKLFIAAALAGQRVGVRIDELGELMTALPTQTAGRALAPEEEALRRLWLSLVYLAYERHASATGAADLVPPSVRAENEPIVERLMEFKASGTSLSEVGVEAVAPTPPSATPRSAFDDALLKQSMRVVYVTVDALEDIELAGARADAPKAPIPNKL
jgi:hypothetical protein